MIKEWDYYSQDPFLGGQITYAYGVVVYSLGGLLWFLTGVQTVNFLIAGSVIISYFVLIKWLKKDSWTSYILLSNFFFIQHDALTACFSNTMFWLGCYAYFNKKKWWYFPVFISGFNHPYTLVSTLVFAISEPILIIPTSLLFSYFAVASKIFTGGVYLPVYTIFMLLARVLLNFMPVFLLLYYGKIKLKHVKIIEKISKIKFPFYSTLLIVTLLCGFGLTLTIYVLVYQPSFNPMVSGMFTGIPDIEENVRVVDYIYLPSIFELPLHNITIGDAGSFRENNNQHMVKTTWNNTEQYEEYINSINVSYVLFCKMCNPQSNEREILKDNYDIVWENKYYYLYNVD